LVRLVRITREFERPSGPGGGTRKGRRTSLQPSTRPMKSIARCCGVYPKWAVSLDREGLVRLGPYHAKGGDLLTLLPRRRADNAGLVTIYNDRGTPSLQFWRSVFERRAPENLPRVEEVTHGRVGQGNTISEVSDELLEALTDAYREAASGRNG
jgi:hypothetical protein